MTARARTAAVIGSGFGGLALAIRLQAAGIATTLFEQRDRPGGRAYVYHDHGFTFDAGPTVITAPDCLEDLFALAGERMADYVDLLPVMPFYRLFWEDGTTFDYSNDLQSVTAQIRRMNPADVDGYRRFLRYAEEVFDEGYTRLAHQPFLNVWSMIRVSPQLLRLQAYRTVYDVVSQYIQHPHLRETFSFHSLLVGGNPFAGNANAKPELYSYGHRNVQGMALHPTTGELWENEFGPRGVDELNLINPGKKDGWPTNNKGIE